MIEPTSHFSSEFSRRREEILQLALKAARQRRRERMPLPIVGAIVILSIGVILEWSPRRENKPTSPLPKLALKSHPSPAPQPVDSAPLATVQFIQSDPTLYEKMVIPAQAPTWQSLSDDEFLQVLADAGKPAGLIQMNGQTYLLPR